MFDDLSIRQFRHDVNWLGIQDSNLEPTVPKTGALPIELIPNKNFNVFEVIGGPYGIRTRDS